MYEEECETYRAKLLANADKFDKLGDKESAVKELDKWHNQVVLEMTYRAVEALNPLLTQWMVIGDGKLVEEKISFLDKFLHGEAISKEEENMVLDPERYNPAIEW